MDEFKDSPRKSLFSIQIDDVVIQRVFQKLQDEVTALEFQVKQLKDDVATKPSRQEISVISKTVDILKEDNTSFKESISKELHSFKMDFTSQFSANKESTKKELTDAIFSINSVVRAQNALIEEKVFELTKPTFEFNEMRAAVSDVKTSHAQVMNELKRLQLSFAHVMEVNSFEEFEGWSLTKAIHLATEGDRSDIKMIQAQINTLSNRIENAEAVARKICRNPNDPLPQWIKSPKYDLKAKPQIPRISTATSFIDYFEYLMQFAPAVQKVLNGFYHQFTILSNQVWENNGEREIPKDNDTRLKEMEDVIEELKLKAISKAELSQIKDEIAELKGIEIPRLKLNKISSRLDELSDKVATIDTFDEKIDSMQKNFESIIHSAMREVQSAIVSPGVSPRFPRDFTAAKTSVTPHANQAHKVMYGEFQNQRTPSRPQTEMKSERSPGSNRKPSLRPLDDLNPSY
ncbi:hypothetical protein TVAG_191070 [Trichomonas vaginalis G3]|uniref:Uncharacterized protein n=1 Tax=Trichomonas vaginalis (strain ATCC PRA-98 / G3) TaxID=412133 RepID=A2EFJ0_TRIV3|nr:hypothetical protein TVAGG3_0820950 [Trichomonas vaginalis G3]EAY08584.1 hypothetical protein TVAG_191070 [Trichomonas vaginalis G3]KAI5497885.1 hypothetical protein TVAGG3_0820950 [Trichomonas vaginalis G3]|eukprot:XP_001320807.1 hypothetical protein [Trichomonas vaginalis G3]